MKRSTYVAAIAALLAWSPAGIAQQAATKPTFAPDGIVHVPPFDLPPSAYLSPEALAMQKSRATMAGPPAMFAMDIAAARAALDKYMEPQVEASATRYPVDITEQQIAGVTTHVVVPKAGETDIARVLINLHGGGFMMCAHACSLMESIPIAALGRFKVVTVDYREGPENIFPAASEDVAAVYRELLKTYRPEKIGIYGCSAGGALTAQSEAWFIAHDLPSPGALGIFGAGGVHFGAGDSAYISGYVDGSLPPPPPSGGPGFQPAYFKGADMESALVSPATHLDVLAKFPPTLIITGTRAPDLSPAVYTNSQLLKAGAKSTLLVGEGMAHCFIYQSNLPEARDAYDIIVRFFDEHLRARRRHSM